MTQFNPGDRVRYVGNNVGKFQSFDKSGDLGTVVDERPGILNDIVVDVHWDHNDITSDAYPWNLELIPEAPAGVDDRESILNKYIEEFDRMVDQGTVVPRYTALGFLTEFLREIEGK